MSDNDLTLNSYLAKNNSTDNLSFSKIMKEYHEKWRKEYNWVFEQEEGLKNKNLAIEQASDNKL